MYMYAANIIPIAGIYGVCELVLTFKPLLYIATKNVIDLYEIKASSTYTYNTNKYINEIHTSEIMHAS